MSHVKPLLIRTVFFCLAALKKTECEESLQKVYRDRENTLSVPDLLLSKLLYRFAINDLEVKGTYLPTQSLFSTKTLKRGFSVCYMEQYLCSTFFFFYRMIVINFFILLRKMLIQRRLKRYANWFVKNLEFFLRTYLLVNENHKK